MSGAVALYFTFLIETGVVAGVRLGLAIFAVGARGAPPRAWHLSLIASSRCVAPSVARFLLPFLVDPAPGHCPSLSRIRTLPCSTLCASLTASSFARCVARLRDGRRV